MKETPQYQETLSGTYNEIRELPTLILKKTTGTSDFMVSELYLESKGYTMDEALLGLADLMEKVKEL